MGWTRRRSYLGILVVVFCGLVIGACGGSTGEKTLGAETPFYLDGPQQARPPDGILAAGTRVLLVREAGSYSLVRLPDGREAYVVSSALR